MKVRSDFVTNSSSSSFIVGFSNEENVAKELKNELYIGNRYNDVLNDIKEGRISKYEALYEFRNEMYWEAKYTVEDEFRRKIGYKKYYDWIDVFENREKLDKAVHERLEVWYQEFAQKIEGYGYLAEVEYCDHDNSDLEHEILPRLECTIQRFSHH